MCFKRRHDETGAAPPPRSTRGETLTLLRHDPGFVAPNPIYAPIARGELVYYRRQARVFVGRRPLDGGRSPPRGRAAIFFAATMETARGSGGAYKLTLGE